MGKTNETKDLIVPDFAVMKHSIEDLQMIIKANVGDAELGPGDLDRVKVPAGGGVVWEVPSASGDLAVKALDGVICAWELPRSYWKESFDSTGGGTPPDCSSPDGILGVGDPGGACTDCPLAQFESAIKSDGTPGKGQACQQKRMMAIVLQDSLIPVILSAPATSLANMRRYFLRLAGAAVPYYGVLTRFTLVKTKGDGVPDHSVIEAKTLEKLGADDLAKMESYAQVMGHALENRAADGGDYTE